MDDDGAVYRIVTTRTKARGEATRNGARSIPVVGRPQQGGGNVSAPMASGGAYHVAGQAHPLRKL
jgi:hypothetical protein